ncbi:unnamed protein product [Cyprideis torosa]|uniref:Structure-specific endonuclease subunit SLX4 n=1 Tax=Cyprideis torosa TaxID=163714 RepID=A0A7R8W5H7_9CRUS|nr:unnamed protein product [Cyprideis torosa]CAG0880404.1 unnamed protein product [Cyprideis torosa]
MTSVRREGPAETVPSQDDSNDDDFAMERSLRRRKQPKRKLPPPSAASTSMEKRRKGAPPHGAPSRGSKSTSEERNQESVSSTSSICSQSDGSRGNSNAIVESQSMAVKEDSSKRQELSEFLSRFRRRRQPPSTSTSSSPKGRGENHVKELKRVVTNAPRRKKKVAMNRSEYILSRRTDEERQVLLTTKVATLFSENAWDSSSVVEPDVPVYEMNPSKFSTQTLKVWRSSRFLYHDGKTPLESFSVPGLLPDERQSVMAGAASPSVPTCSRSSLVDVPGRDPTQEASWKSQSGGDMRTASSNASMELTPGISSLDTQGRLSLFIRMCDESQEEPPSSTGKAPSTPVSSATRPRVAAAECPPSTSGELSPERNEQQSTRRSEEESPTRSEQHDQHPARSVDVSTRSEESQINGEEQSSTGNEQPPTRSDQDSARSEQPQFQNDLWDCSTDENEPVKNAKNVYDKSTNEEGSGKTQGNPDVDDDMEDLFERSTDEEEVRDSPRKNSRPVTAADVEIIEIGSSTDDGRTPVPSDDVVEVSAPAPVAEEDDDELLFDEEPVEAVRCEVASISPGGSGRNAGVINAGPALEVIDHLLTPSSTSKRKLSSEEAKKQILSLFSANGGSEKEQRISDGNSSSSSVELVFQSPKKSADKEIRRLPPPSWRPQIVTPTCSGIRNIGLLESEKSGQLGMSRLVSRKVERELMKLGRRFHLSDLVSQVSSLSPTRRLPMRSRDCSASALVGRRDSEESDVEQRVAQELSPSRDLRQERQNEEQDSDSGIAFSQPLALRSDGIRSCGSPNASTSRWKRTKSVGSFAHAGHEDLQQSNRLEFTPSTTPATVTTLSSQERPDLVPPKSPCNSTPSTIPGPVESVVMSSTSPELHPSPEVATTPGPSQMDRHSPSPRETPALEPIETPVTVCSSNSLVPTPRETHPPHVWAVVAVKDAELSRFGMRALPRKHAVRILDHIFESTHPVVSKATEKDGNEATKVADPMRMSSSEKQNIGENPTGVDNENGLEKEPASETEEENLDSSLNSLPDPDAGLNQEVEGISSQSTSSQQESKRKTEDEQKMIIRQYIRGNSNLRRSILLYEPIWFESLLEELKGSGVGKEVLKQFLNDQCITFRTTAWHAKGTTTKGRRGKEKRGGRQKKALSQIPEGAPAEGASSSKRSNKKTAAGPRKKKTKETATGGASTQP